jgi:hypothetical protein
MIPSGMAIFYCMVSAKLFSSTSLRMSERLHLVTLATMLIHSCLFCLNMYLTENTTAMVTMASRVWTKEIATCNKCFHVVVTMWVLLVTGMKHRGGNLQCYDYHAILWVWVMGFWVNNACILVAGYQCLFPEDGGSRFVYIVGNHLLDCMVSWPRRPHSKFSPLKT